MDELKLEDIIKKYPILLEKKGKYLNTLKNIIGYVPKINIEYATVRFDNNILDVDIDNGVMGYTDDGIEINISKADEIIDIEMSYKPESYIPVIMTCDIVQTDNYIYTIYELLENEADGKIINSIPLFDHSNLELRYENTIYKSYKSIDRIIHDVEYYNIKYKKEDFGYVKLKDMELPFSSFYNKEVNEIINKEFNNIPLIKESFSVLIV